MKKFLLTIIVLGGLGAGAWFIKQRMDEGQHESSPPAISTPAPTATPIPTPTPAIAIKELPVTLPVIDALFFVDLNFATELKSKLQLTDEQITQLRQAAREETANLKETSDDSSMTTTAAGEKAATKVSAIIGAEKAQQFANLALEHWHAAGTGNDTVALSEEPAPLGTPSVMEGAPTPSGTLAAGTSPSPSPTASPTASRAAKTASTASAAFTAPADTRIVVNAPSHRMDVFQDGKLIKSYKVGIGYPEFPLPTGMRRASQIIFNPTWTAPDEPWVESSKTVKVGQRVAAGDKMNPLGVIKIPIGMPSLIHGGKQPAKIGTFASHGCVGLTDKQVQSFAKVLAQVGGIELTDEEIAKRAASRTETKVVKLKNTIPVELRYETMAVEDGKLHIYRDVYDRDTNVEENLESLLATYGVAMSDLTEEEQKHVTAALAAAAPKSAGRDVAPTTNAEKAQQRKANIARQQLTTQLKTRKEIVVEIAALEGKGYPAPVDLETGSAPKPEPKPAKKTEKKTKKTVKKP
ncbi:MAG: L,D-transpeptidase [Acidobacteriota bacterium]